MTAAASRHLLNSAIRTPAIRNCVRFPRHRVIRGLNGHFYPPRRTRWYCKPKKIIHFASSCHLLDIKQAWRLINGRSAGAAKGSGLLSTRENATLISRSLPTPFQPQHIEQKKQWGASQLKTKRAQLVWNPFQRRMLEWAVEVRVWTRPATRNIAKREMISGSTGLERRLWVRWCREKRDKTDNGIARWV